MLRPLREDQTGAARSAMQQDRVAGLDRGTTVNMDEFRADRGRAPEPPPRPGRGDFDSFVAQDLGTANLMHHDRFAFHNDSVSRQVSKTWSHDPAAVLLDSRPFVTRSD